MTDADRTRLAAAAATADYRLAMAAHPNTWIRMSILVAVIMAASVTLTIAIYPWHDLDKFPVWLKPMMLVSFIPTIGAVVGIGWLLAQSLGLQLQPTRRILAIVEAREARPDGRFVRLEQAEGPVTEHRCRRAAATMVKVGTINRGEVGVALCKGDTMLEWHPIPV